MAPVRDRILIVESDPVIADLIGRQALQSVGYQVFMVGDATAAIAKALQWSPDLIITDINMPKMGGLELIKSVKALPGFRFTPILTLTTESRSDRRDEGKKLGATGWLVKPVSGPDLVKVIKQVLPGA